VNRLCLLSAVLVSSCSEYDVQGNNDVDGVGAPDIAVQPETLDFGATGTALEVVRSVRISNLGSNVLDVTGLTIGTEEEGAGTAFTVRDPDMTHRIGPGASVTREIVWTPQSETDSAVLHIASNDPDTEDLAVPLVGRSLYPELTISPDPLTFELLPVGCSLTAPVTLTNTGFGPLTLSNVVSTGTGYALTAVPTWPVELLAGASTTVDVTFTPVVGDDSIIGTLAADSNDRRGLRTSILAGSASAPVEHLDTFEQSDGASVDLMFFLDTSGSMNDDAQNLAANFHLFLEELLAGGIDYQVMVATADDGCHNASIITPTTIDPEGQFAEAVNGPGGMWYEAGLIVTANALAHTGAGQCNEGFVRPSVPVVAVEISDEPDQSPMAWTDHLFDMQIYAPDVIVNGVIGQGTCAVDGGQYHEAIAATGGVDLDICDTNWGDFVLDILGTVTLLSSFPLEAVPVPETIVVTVNGEPGVGWTWDPASNDIVFPPELLPPEEALVEVAYDEAPVCP